MRELLECTCDATSCERPLTAEEFRLSFADDGSVRRAYECACGTVTITVARGHPGR